MPLLTVDTQHEDGAISPLLFGLGVDLPSATYSRPSDTHCIALAGIRSPITLIRVGAETADNYDWLTDQYYDPLSPGRRPKFASNGCFAPPQPTGPGATVLRVLDRVHDLGATAVVVLNGEIDDPQAGAALARLIVRRYGLDFARRIYWEIGNGPATWQYFGVPLAQRSPDNHASCLPDQYAALVTSYAPALTAVLGIDPRIVADEWIVNATDQSWTGVVTAVDTQYFPFNSPDQPISDAAAIAGSVEPVGPNANTHLNNRLDTLRANLDQYNGGRALRLFVGAWNIDASTQATNPLYGASPQAAFVSSMLLHLMRYGHGVALAAWAPPLYTTSQTPFTAGGAPRPAFRVFTALRAFSAAQRLALSPSPSGIDALAARLPDGRLAVALVNTTMRGVALRLRWEGLTQRVAVAMQSFTAATPDGATTHAGDATSFSLTIAPLGVLLVTTR